MYYKIRLGILAIFLLQGITILAQNKTVTLSGTVIDTEKSTLPYVNVTLENQIDATFISGTITNENGIFSIKGITKGEYILKCSYLGFITNTTSVYVGEVSDYLDLGKITLTEDVASLKGVEVIYKADAITDKMDKKSFTLADNITQSGGSVLQAMQNLPGVSIQEGKIPPPTIFCRRSSAITLIAMAS